MVHWPEPCRIALTAAALLVLGGWENREHSQVQVVQAGIDPCGAAWCLDAYVEYRLSATLHEALHNGVPLEVLTDVIVYRKRRFIWDPVVTARHLRHRLEYLVLDKRYRLSMPGTSERRLRFDTLEAALDEMGRIRALPLQLQTATVAPHSHHVRLRSRLDIRALPGPLKLVAYLQDRWQLLSPWKQLDID